MAQRAARNRGGLIVVGGIAVAALLTAAIVIALASGSPDASTAMLITPILILVSLPILVRRARLDGDRRLLWLLVAALVLKLIGSLVRYYVAFDVYGGVADAAGYHDYGSNIADRFRDGVFDTGLPDLTGTNFIRFFTGIVYMVIGSSSLGGFLVFSWIGFWGLYWFYRAYTVAVPEGRTWTYAKLVLFLPSLIYWPSSVGKEAWMVFCLGLAAFGAAKLMTGRNWRGLVLAGLGMLGAAQVRPHVAGLVGLALVAGYVVRPARIGHQNFAMLGKFVGVTAAVVLALILVQRTDDFLEQSAIETRQGVAGVIEQTAERTSIGGSQFQPSILENPARAPIAIPTILFRPFIFEAENFQTLAAAIETTFLLVLAIARFRWGLHALRTMRRQPYVAFALVYVGLFIVAFSGIANFGLLARERVQMLPFFLIFLTIPPPARRDEGRPAEVAEVAELEAVRRQKIRAGRD
jgi:hypothetical protein